MKRSRSSLVVSYLVLAVLTLLFLVPFYVLVRNAFSSQRWLTSPQWHLLPDQWGLGNLRELLANDSVPIVASMWNSTVVAVLQTVGTILLSLMAGYGLARWRGRAASTVLGLTVLTLMVPAAVTFIPTFVMASSLGWVNSLRGLIIPVLFSAFATFLFRQHFLDFPDELTDAAEVDGCNPWTTFWRIVVPNSMGIIGAVGTITFIGAWNAFLWPLLIAQDPAARTVQVTLSTFMTSQRVDVPQLFTGALLAILPVVLVFLVLQRWLVQGVERSGID